MEIVNIFFGLRYFQGGWLRNFWGGGGFDNRGYRSFTTYNGTIAKKQPCFCRVRAQYYKVLYLFFEK